VTEGRGPALRFTTNDVDAAPDVSIRESRKPSLFTPASFVDCARVPVWARRSTLDVRVPGSPLGFAALDVTSRPGAAGSFGGEIVGTTGPLLVRACGDPTGDRGGVFPAGSPSDRIAVDLDDAGTRPILAFDYRDDGDAPVSFTARDEFRMPWKQGVPTLERCGSGRWLHARLPLPRATVLHGRMEIGPVVTGRNLTIRNLALATSGPSAIPRCPGAR
jgi:hypothetical protein